MAEHPEREYVVVSPKYTLGKVGETIKLRLSDGQHKSLLESRAVRLPDKPAPAPKAPEALPVVAEEAPVAETEGK